MVIDAMHKAAFYPSANESRVLLLPATSRDAEAMQKVLRIARIDCRVCRELPDLTDQVKSGVGVLIVTEEALSDGINGLGTAIQSQPVWSDLPIIVLSRSGHEPPKLSSTLAPLGNVSVLERPVRVTTLLSMVQASLRARMRQYEVRHHLAELAIAQQNLKNARDAAEAANQAKDRFLAVLSHELRTPLTPVLMSLATMEADQNSPDSIREEMAMIRRNVQMESRLIDDLLDLSRVSNGKLQLHRQPVELNTAVRQVYEICRAEAMEKGLQPHLELSPTAFWVSADPTRLNQAIWNLLKNAIKFTPEKGQLFLKVSVGVNGNVKLEVRDTGVGILPTVLPNIFNAFEQGGDGVTRKFGGLGLGLAISKALVELHGGSIHAMSKGLGKGSTFTIELPIDATSSQDSAVLNVVGQNPKWETPPRILIVEDHHDTATVLKRHLQRCGLTVTVAGTASTALDIASNEPIDLVISDIGLPDAMGYELMRELSRLYSIKGIAMSGYGMEADIAKSYQAGFSEHLTKPVELAKLEAAIRRIVMPQTQLIPGD